MEAVSSRILVGFVASEPPRELLCVCLIQINPKTYSNTGYITKHIEGFTQASKRAAEKHHPPQGKEEDEGRVNQALYPFERAVHLCYLPGRTLLET